MAGTMRRLMIPAVLGLGAVVGARALLHRPANAAGGFAPAEAATAKAPPRRPASFGVNLAWPVWWANQRAFANLMAGGQWANATGNWPPFDPDRIDRNDTITSMKPGEVAAAFLATPAAVFVGDARIHCTYKGRGAVNIFDGVDIAPHDGSIDFKWLKGHHAVFWITRTDPSDPIREIDCREAGADRTTLFDPAFIAGIRPYKAVRFLDWQPANENPAVVDWAHRALPTRNLRFGGEHVPMEDMVALANQAGVDPWFVMPWNADATYMANFARYVHTHLDPKLTAYVEIGNEVWNGAFPVAAQAIREGKAHGFGADDNVAKMRRYAEHATEDFAIWTREYGADHGRLVRVLSGQAVWPDLLKQALDYKDTARQIDAIAMAPYFGLDLLTKPGVNTADTDALFRAMPGAVDEAIAVMRQDKALADSYGLRLLAYEAGQHIVLYGGDPNVVARLNRDPRMEAMYRRYLDGWKAVAGDRMMLFEDVGAAGKEMAWGLAEYPGQPMSETPKRRAVLAAIAGQD